MTRASLRQSLFPFTRRDGESLREHLERLRRRGGYGSAELAGDVLELLDRVERLERRDGARPG